MRNYVSILNNSPKADCEKARYSMSDAGICLKKVQVGKDKEKAQSEKDSHSKNRGGKKPNEQSGTYTMKHIVSRMSSYFPNRKYRLSCVMSKLFLVS